jgi:outer membrane autotransporter protein
VSKTLWFQECSRFPPAHSKRSLAIPAISHRRAQLGGTSVEVGGTRVKQGRKKLRGEVGLGANYAINDKWSFYGEVDAAMALASGSGKNYAVKGSAGLKYKW